MTATARATRRPVVTFVTRILTHYRIPFHEAVRSALAAASIDYRLVHGQPDGEEVAKGDLATVPWATQVRNRPLFGRGKLVWQPIGHAVRDSDLLVLGQENQLLVNYPLQLLPASLRPKIALWGHGRNFQARNCNSRAEQWKRYWARRADWWFAYTVETHRHVASLGFPADRITVFNNAVDTAKVRAQAAAVTLERCAARRAELGMGDGPTAIFVGGLYADKRLTFLINAVDRVQRRLPGFTLLVAGGGVDRPLVEKLAADRPWIKVLGPRFGTDKVELMRLADLFLMPGLLGLAVLDAAAAGLPTVTTAFPWHSPEIAYVEHGVNGLIVADWQDPVAYGDVVANLLADRKRLVAMTAQAKALSQRYTIEAMAERFATGACAALAAPLRQ